MSHVLGPLRLRAHVEEFKATKWFYQFPEQSPRWAGPFMTRELALKTASDARFVTFEDSKWKIC